MRIILIGPPGSGKGTQAYFLTKYYNIPIISIGGMLRDIANEKSDLSKIIKKTINSGRLLSNEIIINLVKEKFKNIDYNHSFLLDGFPRTITQAYAMKIINISVDYVLVFLASTRLIVERIAHRYIHSSSGRIYHSKFNPPKKKGYDDITGEILISRKDDNENVIRNRLMEYYCYTKPVIYFYQQEANINSNLRYYCINADQNILDIQNELIKILN